MMGKGKFQMALNPRNIDYFVEAWYSLEQYIGW